MKYDSIIICGPTASGKTSLSIDLAKKLNSEIINADSMYLYKEFNIGTSKPNLDEMSGIKHHLIDFLEPLADFSVTEYKSLALNLINECKNKKLMPIIVGGTGFYIDSLTKDYSYGNNVKDDDLRNYYMTLAKNKGNIAVFNILKKLDPDSATRLHYNDLKRVIRAIEIAKTTIEPKIKSQTKQDLIINPLIIGTNMPRVELYEKINKRVDVFIKNGLIDEARNLYDKYPKDIQPMKAIGYKELFSYFAGEIDLANAIDLIKQHSRNYAKRQITWFKRNENIHWFDTSKQSNEYIINEIIKML